MKDFSEISEALAGTPLFSGKTWRVAAEPWRFSEEAARGLREIGDACTAFYRALERLYLAGAAGKNLLRNGELRAPWAAEILDRGKPPELLAHGRAPALAGTLPPVIRPDLLATETGFALTELDSVPGGVGLTAFLARLYGCADAMPELFLNAVRGGNADARVVVAVSEEAATYRPEFEWLAETLRRERGAAIEVCDPNELEISDAGVFFAGKRADVVYRFFELFDLANFRGAAALAAQAERGNVRVVPPMRAFQEEKLSLALFRHPSLEPFWREALGERHFGTLRGIVPATWIVEPLGELPAGALLHAPRPMRDWRELARAPRRERDFVLKASGFAENAWGARSVTVGNDASQTEWAAAVDEALSAGARGSLYVLQEFRKPKRVPFAVFDDAGTRRETLGRARICPYYFVGPDGSTTLGGALATVCPADKKIIHGMSSASLAPCAF